MAEYVMPLCIYVNLTSGLWIWYFCLVGLEYTEKLVLKQEELQITNIANDKIYRYGTVNTQSNNYIMRLILFWPR